MDRLLVDVSLGNNLRYLRKSKGLSQSALVSQMQIMGNNISRITYNKIEQGTRNLYVSDLIRLKRIYSVSFDDFFKNIEI
mgnify:FL=1